MYNMSVADELSELIQEEYRCISCKINYAEGESTDDVPDNLYSVIAYFRDTELDVAFSTCGLHLLGENARPHIHFHLIVKSLPSGTFTSCNSTHRRRWLSKEGNEGYSFDNVSIRFPRRENPVWQHLAYPYKEGHVISRHPYLNQNVHPYLSFLREYAQNLFQVALGNRARQEACNERKKQALVNLGKLCEDHKDEFNNYREMILWLDTNYIEKLELDEYPDPRNYKTNCQKICVRLGKLKYSDIV